VVAKSDVTLNVPTANELRVYLREQLPEYMIPETFVYLGEMPLNANGKVDRGALPAPDSSITGQEFVEPRTSLEKEVAVVCRQILGIERIGIYDNLFDLGCNSIKATIIISRLREAFNIGLPLHRFFEGPTLHDLTLAIAQMHLEQLTVEESTDFLGSLERLSNDEVHALLD
jgi:acyl carrier protein